MPISESLKEFLKANYENLNRDDSDGCGTRLFVPYKEPIGNVVELFKKHMDRENHIFTKEKLERGVIFQISLALSKLETEIMEAAVELKLDLSEQNRNKLKTAYCFKSTSQLAQLTEYGPEEIVGFQRLLTAVMEKMKQQDILDETYVTTIRNNFAKIKQAIFSKPSVQNGLQSATKEKPTTRSTSFEASTSGQKTDLDPSSIRRPTQSLQSIDIRGLNSKKLNDNKGKSRSFNASNTEQAQPAQSASLQVNTGTSNGNLGNDKASSSSKSKQRYSFLGKKPQIIVSNDSQDDSKKSKHSSIKLSNSNT